MHTIENDPRFKDLLDEIVKKTTGHYSYQHLCDILDKDKSYSGPWYIVREKALHAFYEEKMHEKDTHFNKQADELISNYKSSLTAKLETALTTIIEKDKQIVSQTVVINDLKNTIQELENIKSNTSIVELSEKEEQELWYDVVNLAKTQDSLLVVCRAYHNAIKAKEFKNLLTELKKAKDTIKQLEENSLESLETKRLEWSKKVFPNADSWSSLLKLDEEIKEIKYELEHVFGSTNLITEFADALMCLFDSAGREGITPYDITKAFKFKLELNMSSDWIDQGNGTYKRVKK